MDEGNGTYKKWHSRSLWLLVGFGLISTILSIHLDTPVPFTTVVTVGVAGWFGGKIMQGKGV